MSDVATVKVGDLVTLDVGYAGFVVYNIGRGAKRVRFRGISLMDFLQELGNQFGSVKEDVNANWRQLRCPDVGQPEKSMAIRNLLYKAFWAHALVMELKPFTLACVDGPTNPLYILYIRRLEEVSIRCFTAAFVCGSADESMIGLHGLLTDFELNGGVDLKTCGLGPGFQISLSDYFTAHFKPMGRDPIVYAKFGELMEAIADRVITRYKKIGPTFSAWINERLRDDQQGFANEFTSPAKTALLAQLKNLVRKFAGPKASQIQIA